VEDGRRGRDVAQCLGRLRPHGSVGAVSFASNPNIVYVGMGEACLRGNLSSGRGGGIGGQQTIGPLTQDCRERAAPKRLVLSHRGNGGCDQIGADECRDGGSEGDERTRRATKAASSLPAARRSHVGDHARGPCFESRHNNFK